MTGAADFVADAAGAVDISNTLLMQTPQESLAAWQPNLVRLHVQSGAVLQTAGQPQRHVYFPVGAVAARVHNVSSEALLCVALIGRSGMVGSDVALGTSLAADSFVVAVAGEVLRLEAGLLRSQMEQVGATRHLYLAFVQSQITEIAHTAVCGRFYTVEPHLCTRLLQLFSEGGPMELALTQDLLAQLVGTRRERVNHFLREMQDAGLIEISRGALCLLDRPAVLKRACPCRTLLAPLQDERTGL